MELDRQPTLEGAGPDSSIALRPLTLSDWEPLFAVASDPLIWEVHPAHDRWQESVFRTFFDDALAKGGALAVIDTGVGGATGKIIGSSRYQGYDPANGGSVEIGWTFLARAYWGGAVNREVKRLMLAHALASVAECRFEVGADNIRSRKAMEKIGGVLSDHTEERMMAGVSKTHVRYVITREAFAAGPLSNRN